MNDTIDMPLTPSYSSRVQSVNHGWINQAILDHAKFTSQSQDNRISVPYPTSANASEVQVPIRASTVEHFQSALSRYLERFLNDADIDTTTKLRFAQIKQVEAIYKCETEGEIRYWVFTNNQKYDDAVMDTLLDQEVAILVKYPTKNIRFSYVPLVLCSDPYDVVDSGAVSILQR